MQFAPTLGGIDSRRMASVITTSISNIPRPKYIQETLDHYTDERCRITTLSSHDCGKKVVCMSKKYYELSKSWLESHPYIKLVITLKRQVCSRKNKDKNRFRTRHQNLYPGLPCYKCLKLIPINTSQRRVGLIQVVSLPLC